MHNFQGKVFGDYQAVAKTDRRNSVGYVFWRLQCLVCGDNKTVSAQALVARLVKGHMYKCPNTPTRLPVVASSGVRTAFSTRGPGMYPFRVEIEGFPYNGGELVRLQVVDSVVKFVPSRLPDVRPGFLGRAFSAGRVKLYLSGQGRRTSEKWLVPQENIEWVSRTEVLPPSPVEFETGAQTLAVEMGSLARLQIVDSDLDWSAFVTCGEQSLLVTVDSRNRGNVYPLAADALSLFWPEHTLLLDMIWPYLPMEGCIDRPTVAQYGMWVNISGDAQDGVYAKPQGVPAHVQAAIARTCAGQRVWLINPDAGIPHGEPAPR